jgi:UDP-GlcNAc:undecaprenyl-phosphate GlcNAc-1-phosphate transferase
MNPPVLALGLAFAASLAGAAAATPVVRAAAVRYGLVARPSTDRWHQRPTALFGGVGIYVGFLAGLAAVSLSQGGADGLRLGPAAWGIILSTSMMFVTGLVDDRYHLAPGAKLVLQGLAGAVLVGFGVVYPLTPWVPANIVATLFWFVALTNALNLLDNMDGVVAGVAGIASAFLAVTFGLHGEWALAAVCLALAGSTAGFLFYNFNPASIFMGDSGSLFLGAVLAGMGAAYPRTAPGSIVSVMFGPALIVIIPIIDTALVTLTRTLAGHSIAQGGRDHTSHRLVTMGLSERQVALLLYALAACGGGVALLPRHAPTALSVWGGGLFLVALLLFATYLSRLHTYPAGERASGRATVLVGNLLYKRRALEVVLDLTVFALAYSGAFLLRWEGALSAPRAALLEASLPVAVGVKLATFWAMGVYRGIWPQTSLADLHRLVRASGAASLLTVCVVLLLFRESPFSRSVLIMDGLLAAGLVIGARLSFRSFDRLRYRLTLAGEPVLVFGADAGGELMVKALHTHREFNLVPVGFIDDDGRTHGRLLQGLPVLGGTDRLGAGAPAATKLVVDPARLEAARVQALAQACARRGVEFLEMTISVRPSPHPARAAAPYGPAAPAAPPSDGS